MPTRPKSTVVLMEEKRSHRTKTELSERKQAEQSCLSGQKMRERPEVKKNEIAHKEFLRLKKILEKINKNDALYEPIINRFCMIQSECYDFEEKREQFYSNMQAFEEDAEEMIKKDEITRKEYYKMLGEFESSIIAIDKQLTAKRKMMMDIEKECSMTIASAARTIPAQVKKKKSALEAALGG